MIQNKTNRKYPPFRPGSFAKALVFFCFFICCSFKPPENINTEYKLKAAFIYNFIQFIDWGAAVPPNTDEYIIGIMGYSPIDDPLHEIALTKTINNKKIVIRHYNTPEEIRFCHILFIPRDAQAPLNSILAKLPAGTLSVSERQGSARQGAAMNFIIIDNKLKFESNLKALNSAGLKASSQLLKLAIIIG